MTYTKGWKMSIETRREVEWALATLLNYMRMDTRTAVAPSEFHAAKIERVKHIQKLISPTHKDCLRCGPQPIGNFYIQRVTKFGEYLQSYCKTCNTLNRREDRARRNKKYEKPCAEKIT